MHSDLSYHLHSAECNEIIQKLKKCHENNKIGKVFGVCNALDDLLLGCLRKERADNARKNHEKAEIKRKQLREKLKQV